MSDENLWDDLKRLASLTPGDLLFLPHEQACFDLAARTDEQATQLLRYLWVPVAALCAGSWFAALAVPVGIQSLLVFVCAVLSALISYYATGWLPHIASQRANRAQDLEEHLAKHMERVAAFLAAAHVDNDPRVRQQALLVARAMDVKLLRARAIVSTFSHSDDMIDPLEVSATRLSLLCVCVCVCVCLCVCLCVCVCVCVESVANLTDAAIRQDAVEFVLQDAAHVLLLSWRSAAIRAFVDSLLSFRQLDDLRARLAELERRST